MFKSLLLTLLACTGWAAHISAQSSGWCGTTREALDMITGRLLANKEAYQNGAVQFRNTIYVPVKFHLVGRNDGSGVIAKRKVLDQLCSLNEDFAGVGLQFYIKGGFNYINNTAVYTNHQNTVNTIMAFARDNAAVNIYIPESANQGNAPGPSVVLGYNDPTPGRDWLVMSKAEIQKDGITLSHEMGHWFSLLHPFNGWEGEPYDDAVHGNPVTLTTAPSVSLAPPYGFIPVELVNRSANCGSAGDFLCDTPPDYNFGLGWPNCNYNAGVMDSNGDLIDTEEKLFMGYFLECEPDDYFFTESQKAMMIQDYNSGARSYIRTGHIPNLTEMNEAPALLAPADDAVLGYYNAVNFDWEDIPGADFYLLEVARNASFSDQQIAYEEMVAGSSKVANGLEAGRTYYWRVTPMTYYRTCAPASEVFQIQTGNAVSAGSNELIEGFVAAPNPAVSGQNLRVSLQSRSGFRGSLSLINAMGQELRAFGQREFAAGNTSLELSLPRLEGGLYFLSLDTEKGKLVRKIIVND